MKIPPYKDGEKVCRVCKRFVTLKNCWISVDKYGENCLQFQFDKDRARLLPQGEK